MTMFELGAEDNSALTRWIKAAKAAARHARRTAGRTTCCGVAYNEWCRPGCRNYAMNGAAPRQAGSW